MSRPADLLRPADVLLVVPPFAWRDRPALGAHLLQAAARRAGFEVQVLYAGFLFSAFFDEGTHDTIAQMQYGLYLGERLFARAALGTPPLGRDEGAGIAPTIDALNRAYDKMGLRSTFTLDALRRVEARVDDWLATFVPAIAARGYRFVGCTTSFEQTCSSIAILAGVKRARPETITIIGGANCEGEMGEGVAALAPAIDHIFSGESEAAFVRFLEGGARERIVSGAPCEDLDALATPDYADYFAQLEAVLPSSPLVTKRRSHLAYETSRGCWWGEKSHCTFCGLNGQGMASREKSPGRAIAELRALVDRHGVKRIVMTDNIMPHAYFRTFLPRLAAELPGVQVMYEQKANMTLAQVAELVSAGVTEIQPGIEALSTSLLRLMAKGTTTAQNVALLRYARATGLFLQWNLLHGFPGDALEAYEETLELLPLVVHLQPPVSPCPVVIDRFSPYHMHPERYGISELRPFRFYEGVLPETALLDKLAYHFEGTFASAAREHPEVVKRIADEVATWRARWYGAARPELRVERAGGRFRLVDTRGATPIDETIDEAQARLALVVHPARERDRAGWALERRVVVERDQKLVPLAVAEPALLAEMEQRARRPSAALEVAG